MFMRGACANSYLSTGSGSQCLHLSRCLCTALPVTHGASIGCLAMVKAIGSALCGSRATALVYICFISEELRAGLRHLHTAPRRPELVRQRCVRGLRHPAVKAGSGRTGLCLVKGSCGLLGAWLHTLAHARELPLITNKQARLRGRKREAGCSQ